MDPDELEAAIRGAKSKVSKAPKALALDPKDALIRTVLGEASPDASDDERQWVGAVVANRAKAKGKSYTDVVQEPGQFEAWQRDRAKLLAYKPTDPAYQATEAALQPILNGKDPTGGATYFYHPDAQAALGRSKPGFDDGSGVQVGKGLFFRQPYGDEPGPDVGLEGAIRGEQQPGTVRLEDPSAGATTAASPGVINKAQQTAFEDATKKGTFNPQAPKGSILNPYYSTKEGDQPDQPGVYFRDWKGELQRTPGGGMDPIAVGQKIWEAEKKGDIGSALKLSYDYGQGAVEATRSGALSGLMLGGKNEASAIMAHPMDFVTKGGIDAPSIQSGIAQRDQADVVRRANYPMNFTGGQVAGAVGGGLALSTLTGGAGEVPLLGRLAMSIPEGAAVGGAQGYLAADGSNAQRSAAGGEGAKFGAMLGPAGEIAQSFGGVVAKHVLGMQVPRETAQLAAKARGFGIDLRGGQISDSPFVKYADSVLNGTPFTGYAKSSAQQRQAFTAAVAKSFGENAHGLTPDVMTAARKRIGGEFDRIAKGTTIKDVDELQTGMSAVIGDAQKVLGDSEVKPLLNQVQEIASSITTKANGARELSGDSLQALMRKGSPLERLTKSADPNVRFYADKLEGTLMDAMGRNASAADVAAYKTARTQWARMKTVEPLVEKAGPEGQISPALLLERMRATYDNFAYDGGGQLGDLSRIGQRFLKEPPNSGTADRSRIMRLLEVGGLGSAGAGAFWVASHPEEAAKLGLVGGASLAATLLLGKGAAAALNSEAYKAALLRSAKVAPAVVGKGRPLFNAPYLLSPPMAAEVGGRVLNPQQTTSP